MDRHRGDQRGLSQQTRLRIAVAYIAVFLALGIYLSGSVPPPTGIAGSWFWTATVTFGLTALMTEPNYTRPVDTLASGIAVLIGAVSVSLDGSALPPSQLEAGRLAFAGFGGLLIVVAALAILFKDDSGLWGRVAGGSSRAIRVYGRATIVLSVVFVASVYAAFSHDADRLVVALATWMLVVGAQPLEGLARVFRGRRRGQGQRAVLEAFEDPDLVLLRLPAGALVPVGATIDLGQSRRGTVVDATTLLREQRVRVAMPSVARISEGDSFEFSIERPTRTAIGYVGEGTTFTELRIRTAAASGAMGLREGCLLEVGESASPHLYLVTAARALDRAEAGGHRFVIEIVARQIGQWNEAEGTFSISPWPPYPGTPVFLAPEPTDRPVDTQWVGLVPGTAHGTEPLLDDLVTNNTAVLGVLGSGKTSLAVQLIRRMIAGQVKVVVLDITRRYAFDFRDVYPREMAEKVNGFVRSNASTEDVALRLVKRFLAGAQPLLIINPADLMTARRATLAHATHAIADAMLELARETYPEEDPDGAKFCLVLEEAHSLVPESGSAVDRNETGEVNGTTRAVLQGRKYGLGCLLVTQRSANVAKSVLNQCNTMFAMRMYDDTGINFMSNYVGLDFARLLPTLKPYRCIAFGKGLKSASPVVLDVHEPEAFKIAFWDPIAAGLIPAQRPTEEDAAAVGGSSVAGQSGTESTLGTPGESTSARDVATGGPSLPPDGPHAATEGLDQG